MEQVMKDELPLAHLCKMKVCACKVVAKRKEERDEPMVVASDSLDHIKGDDSDVPT